MRLGVICPSEIAIRRFMPALQQCDGVEFRGIGVYTKEERYGECDIPDEEFQLALAKEKDKAYVFLEQYGGRLYNSYKEVVTAADIDAVYIPLPPSLHFKWAKIALENGKHVLVEKPATTSAVHTKELVDIASKRGLAFHENYMFTFHKQMDVIKDIIKSGEIGDIRLYRIAFGFPRRSPDDFRYNKALGGGALIDAGGYTIRCATYFLGHSGEIRYAQSNYTDEFDVDMYGSASLVNDEGITAQIAFGMDNNYKCDLEAWGSKGCLFTGRILTAPVGYKPTVTIRKGNEENTIDLPEDDAFLKSINHFIDCIHDDRTRGERYRIIRRQAELVDDFRRMADVK